MDVYIWQADIYCEDCGKAIAARLECDVPADERDNWTNSRKAHMTTVAERQIVRNIARHVMCSWKTR